MRGLISGWLATLVVALSGPVAWAGCDVNKIEAFLQDRAFTLAADEKINLYADRIHRYYGKSDQSRREVLNAMRSWESRWPDRIYRYLAIREFEETEARDACRVVFDYKFIAYDPARDETSAGIGRTTFVIAERGPDRDLKIVGEWGDVLCRGLGTFERGRC